MDRFGHAACRLYTIGFAALVIGPLPDRSRVTPLALQSPPYCQNERSSSPYRPGLSRVVFQVHRYLARLRKDVVKWTKALGRQLECC